MNKRIDNDQSSLRPSLPLGVEKPNTRRVRVRRRITQQVDNNVNVSYQDVRNLAATLYLTEIPGLGSLQDDWDSLIDRYYEPIFLTD